jgi:hypothetical protein
MNALIQEDKTNLRLGTNMESSDTSIMYETEEVLFYISSFLWKWDMLS